MSVTESVRLSRVHCSVKYSEMSGLLFQDYAAKS